MAPARTARTTSVAGSHAARRNSPLVRTGWALGKPRGQKDVGLLVGKAGRAVDAHEVAQVGCHKAGLLGKLASGGRVGLLAGLQAAGGNLQRHAAERAAVLADQADPPLPHGNHTDAAMVAGYEARGAGAVCGLDLKALGGKDRRLRQRLGANDLLGKRRVRQKGVPHACGDLRGIHGAS